MAAAPRAGAGSGFFVKPSSLILGLIIAGTLGFLAVLAAVFLMGDSAGGVPDPIASAAPELAENQGSEHLLRIAERAVSSDSIIAMSMDRFRRTMGRYPESLQELTTVPSAVPSGAHWDGPYINNPQLLVDPWGNAYRYAFPGKHNDFAFDLWSLGPDGAPDTADDVGNW